MYIITRDENVDIRLNVENYKKLPKGSEVNIYGPIPFDFLEKEYIFRTARERGYRLMSRDALEMYYLILNEAC